MRTSERGFTYLLLLFALVAGGVALAAAGERWQVALQREREQELLFRGGEIRQAIESYAARRIDGASAYPQRLEDLLEDTRQGATRYHLRRLYLDPFTAAPDWLTLRDAAGHIVGVHSRSRVLALARQALPVSVLITGGPETEPRVGDWMFFAAGTVPLPP